MKNGIERNSEAETMNKKEDTMRKVAKAIGRERFVTVLTEALETAVALEAAYRAGAKKRNRP